MISVVRIFIAKHSLVVCFPRAGSSNMPTWGPIFSIIEKGNEKAVQERIKRLSAYLASLQEK
jgi:hypothetical protein